MLKQGCESRAGGPKLERHEVSFGSPDVFSENNSNELKINKYMNHCFCWGSYNAL